MKKKAGRKPKDQKEKKVIKSISFSPEIAEILSEMDNISKFVERAVSKELEAS